ncbi:relaxase NikB, partial [Photobacterium indicum]
GIRDRWGRGLKGAIAVSGAQVGDAINLTRTGERDVTVQQAIKDSDGQVIGSEDVAAKRVEWHVEVQSKSDMHNNERYTVTYQWSAEDAKMGVSINGEKPSQVGEEILNRLMKADRFLSQYSKADVESGKLDLKQANGQHPVSNTYSASGDVIEEVMKRGSMKM